MSLVFAGELPAAILLELPHLGAASKNLRTNMTSIGDWVKMMLITLP